MLLSFGSNGAGQLNVGHDEDLNKPAKCLLSPSTSADEVKIIGGGNHTFIKTDDKIYLAGNDKPLYLPETAVKSSLSGVLEFSNVHSFAATWDAFAVLMKGADDKSHIYTFGSTEKGQLGREPQSSEQDGSRSRAVKLPRSLVDQTIVDIVGGVQHFVAILGSGEAVGWGNGRKGQLGLPAGVIEEPRKIEGVDFKVQKVCCGREFTYLLGDPTKGQHIVLGSDKWNVKSQAPSDVRGWKTAGASWGGISVLFDSGKVVSWGRNDHGQLAPEDLPPITDIAVGSEHTIALSQDGQILVWGWGEHGNCGVPVDADGDVKRGWNVVELPSSEVGWKVRGLGAGCATSWIWCGATESS